MKKNELISEIASATGLGKRQCELLMETLLDMITRSLKNHIEVNISGLGTFAIRAKEIREDEVSMYHEGEMKRWVPVFRASKELNNRFNNDSTLSSFKERIKTKSQNQTGSFDANLNNQSKLGALGYSVQLSRYERWIILKEKAIPKYGVDQVRNHISWLVRLKKKDRHQDYRSAIFEWEYDLKRIDNLWNKVKFE